MSHDYFRRRNVQTTVQFRMPSGIDYRASNPLSLVHTLPASLFDESVPVAWLSAVELQRRSCGPLRRCCLLSPNLSRWALA